MNIMIICALLITVYTNYSMHNESKSILTEEGIKTVFTLAIANGLTTEETQFLPRLQATEVLTELFAKDSQARERFYKNILFKTIKDPYRSDIGAQIILKTLPITIKELKSLPLKKIQSQEIRTFIIAVFFTRLYKIKTNNGCIGNEAATIILRYLSIYDLVYTLKQTSHHKHSSCYSKECGFWRS